jgi:hypothetical protein
MAISSIDIQPAAGPGKAALITDRVANSIISLSSMKAGGSALIVLDLGPDPDSKVTLTTHPPRI